MSELQLNNEIFISYSRLNKNFVQQLVEKLKIKNIDPWYDKDDIENSREWWPEIKKGIIGANAFVFVISSASLRSPVCNWELAQAFSSSKKIIPILFQDVFLNEEVLAELPRLEWEDPDSNNVKANDNWEKLRRIDFIPFPDHESTDVIVAKIIYLARTDFDFVEEHTRLLRRAVEWKAKGKRFAFLLRGDEIKEAERWLTSSATKEPPPSNLHNDYILSSQVHARRQRRNLIIGIFAVLVIITTVTIFGLSENRTAEEQEGLRIINERESASRRLASQALIASQDYRYDVSLLLSVEAIRQAHTYEAQNSLISMLQDTMFINSFVYDRILGFTPESKRLITLSNNKQVVIRDIKEYHAYTLEFQNEPITVDNAILSKDGRLVAIDHEKRTVHIVDLVPDEPVLVATLMFVNAIDYVTIDESSHLALIGDSSGEVHIIDVNAGVETVSIHVQLDSEAEYRFLDISPSGNRLLSETSQYITLWDLRTKEQIGQPMTNTALANYLTFTPDNRAFLLAAYDHSYELIELETGRVIENVYGLPAFGPKVAISSTGRWLVMDELLWDLVRLQRYSLSDEVSNSDEVRNIIFNFNESVVNLVRGGMFGNSPSLVTSWRLPWNDDASSSPTKLPDPIQFDSYAYPSYSPDGEFTDFGICTEFGRQGVCTESKLQRRSASGNLDLLPLDGESWVSNYSPDGRFFVSKSSTEAIVWESPGTMPFPDSTLFSEIAHIPEENQANSTDIFRISADAHIIAGVPQVDFRGTSINVWSVPDNSYYSIPEYGVIDLNFSRDSLELLALTDEGVVTTWNLNNKKLTNKCSVSEEFKYVHFESDEEPVFLSDYDENTIQLDLSTCTIVHQFLGRYPLLGANQGVLATFFDETMILWDIDSGNKLTENPFPDPVFEAPSAVSSNRQWFASSEGGVWDGETYVWDVASGTRLGPAIVRSPYGGFVHSLAFSPDNRMLAIGEDLGLWLWDINTLKPIGNRFDLPSPIIVAFDFEMAFNKVIAFDGRSLYQLGLDSESLILRACRIANRNFTMDEWRQYFPGQTYKDTCVF